MRHSDAAVPLCLDTDHVSQGKCQFLMVLETSFILDCPSYWAGQSVLIPMPVVFRGSSYYMRRAEARIVLVLLEVRCRAVLLELRLKFFLIHL